MKFFHRVVALSSGLRSGPIGLILALLTGLVGTSAGAQVARSSSSELDALVVADGRLLPPPAFEPVAGRGDLLAPEVENAWLRFLDERGGEWTADRDLRGGRIGYVEGSGTPWIPGAGNRLLSRDLDLPLESDGTLGLAALERLARRDLGRFGRMLGVEPDDLVLNRGRSGHPAPHLWLVDFDLVRDRLPVEGARVVFRINNGNLIQLGTEGLPDPEAAVPETRLDREAAREKLYAYVGTIDTTYDEILDPGTLKLLPAIPEREFLLGAVPESGLELVKVWEFLFRRDGEVGTWRVRVDATSGEVLEFVDVNAYATAQVTGGVHAGDDLPPDTVLPMPFANLSIGGFTNSAGQYDYTSGTVTSTLDGQYVRIVDTCGAISQSGNAGTSGNILFGSSGGTDCTTPGSGGAGNTRATRTQYYHVNRAKEIGRGWLPSNAWLNAKLTVNVNIVDTCNAFWNGSTLNFFRSGGGCGNTGELPGVSLHEWGHGMDSNDGSGATPDNGTGETYGDFSAALSTHDSCIGGGFLGGNCGGYGNACTSCTGVRDIDWAQHAANTPSTVANFTQPSCPQPSPFNPNYVGPCGRDAIATNQNSKKREGHCESYVSSEALWDFAERDLPAAGSGSAWSIVDRLWYLSRSTSTGAFICSVTPAVWTSTGCATGTNWRTMRAADDDDGNLANGTPHSCNLFAAFNRHGIACAGDPGANVCFSSCTPPATPTVTLSPGDNQMQVSWSSSGAGVSYDVYRNEVGCSAGFIRVAAGLTGTSFLDTGVANGTTYYYQVVAYPTGNPACAGSPSTCVSAAPTACTAIAAPTGVGAVATASNQITVTWSDSATAGVTDYAVLRSTSSGGPYAQIATVPDTGGPYAYPDAGVSGGTTYYYVVRALASGGCQSPISLEASATATGECTLAPLFSGLQSVTALGGGQGCGLRLAWNAALSQCGAPVTYAVYRSTSSGFTPTPANRITECVSGTTWDDTTMPLDTSVYYVLRAEGADGLGGGPCNGGGLDANLAEVSGYSSSTGVEQLFLDDFETGSGLNGWATGTFGGDDSIDWRGIQTCAAHGGSRIFRFGATTCTGNYSVNDFTFAEPGGSGGLAIPGGSTNVRLDFWHRWVFETGWDGGLLALSLNGTNYTLVPASAFLSNPYNGTTDNGAGYPAWTGNQSTFVNSVVDLDAACVVAGAAGGCAGQSVRIGFTGYSDGFVNEAGWYLDDVLVTRDGGPACTAAPQPVEFLTATGRDQEVTVEWLDPGSGPFASARLRTSTSGYPVDPTDGALLIDEGGISGEKEAFVHATGGGSNGVVQYYSAFSNSGAGVYSARRTVAGLPVDASGPLRWNFATPASALAPPIQGRGEGVFAPSNDRALYNLTPGAGAGGGNWRPGFHPAAMNAPTQSSPIVMLAADTGLPHDAAFVGSQDGHVYCFDTATGAGCTGWPAGGRSADGFGMVQAQPMFDPATGRILFGSRNASGPNGFHALEVLDGTTAWSFTNAVAQGGDDAEMGMISGPALILGGRVVFASRTRGGGSANSVWALDFGSGSASLAWARQLGDVDGAPTHDWTANRVLVGTNAGLVFALDPSAGATVWSRAIGDGAIRTWIYFDAATSRLMFATDGSVRSIPASGATGGDWVVSGLFSPTRPILHFGTTRSYLGACADMACTTGRVVELDSADSWTTPVTYDLPGFGGLGPVTIDRSQSLLHAGSRSGRVVAVQVPLP